MTATLRGQAYKHFSSERQFTRACDLIAHAFALTGCAGCDAATLRFTITECDSSRP
ncbi:hypothetical protein B7755_031650 [Streptomyces sp. NBS 14/10]|uniref:hypothetical protein n=1 Tax=Streptomyces sp. NBS 14/10 TaxID=1945643 RepID=UPI0015C5AF75|nr:hypothetical protein [Streptomyces sp. NBS 14/10]KAK1182285.1 hypothetical protein B7755_031650 [Streptomyces sp. NBS 14/10]